MLWFSFLVPFWVASPQCACSLGRKLHFLISVLRSVSKQPNLNWISTQWCSGTSVCYAVSQEGILSAWGKGTIVPFFLGKFQKLQWVNLDLHRYKAGTRSKLICAGSSILGRRIGYSMCQGGQSHFPLLSSPNTFHCLLPLSWIYLSDRHPSLHLCAQNSPLAHQLVSCLTVHWQNIRSAGA